MEFSNMKQPPGLKRGDENLFFCNLNKALRRLKQTSKQLNSKADTFLTKKLGVDSKFSDECVYRQKCSVGKLRIAFHADYLLIACVIGFFSLNTEAGLNKGFKMKYHENGHRL